MAWNGWWAYDGNEFINATRTETYVRAGQGYWFRPLYKNESLPYMLGDGVKYATPLHDNCPWLDPDDDASQSFWGFYPLDITGIEDSTRQSAPVESLGDGGVPGRLRNGTKTIVFNGILLADDSAGAEYGMRWLKQALNGDACGASPYSAFGGADLCYLGSEPEMYLPSDPESNLHSVNSGPWVDDPNDCLTPYLRTLKNVVFNSGPTVTARQVTSDGAYIWTVTFTAVAGMPYEYGAETPVIVGLLDPDVAVPWAGGVPPSGGTIDLNGYIAPESECDVLPDLSPITDPLYPALLPPPAPPNVPLGNYAPPKNWRRRQFTIPKQYVPLWGEVVPKVSIHARTADLRTLRLRFYADPYQIGDISDDPCAYCGDIVVAYVPESHSLIIDGTSQTVWVESPGGSRRRGDSLVYKTDGTPFDWPILSCGFGYVVTLDLPQTQAPPVVDLSLYARAV